MTASWITGSFIYLNHIVTKRNRVDKVPNKQVSKLSVINEEIMSKRGVGIGTTFLLNLDHVQSMQWRMNITYIMGAGNREIANLPAMSYEDYLKMVHDFAGYAHAGRNMIIINTMTGEIGEHKSD
jgi:hypothetical protein